MKPAKLTGPVVVALSLALLVVGCSSSGGSKEKPQYSEAGTSTLNATVQDIDYPTRMITLKGDSGGTVTFPVDNRVKNLERVKVGDHVRAQYSESVAIRVRDPRESGGDPAKASANLGDWTEGPNGSFGRESTLTAVVEQVDRKKGTVALRGPAGNVHAFQVRDRKNLENVKVGDEVIATHREALAVAITPIGK